MNEDKVSNKKTQKVGSEDLAVGDVPHRKRSDEFSAGQPDAERMPSSEGGGQRAYSPSSVSSAASTRPLEWDSGADVGYLLQNEERQLANAIKKLGLGLGSSSRSEGDQKETIFGNKKTTVDSLQEEDSASAPLSESTPKVVENLKKSSLGGSRQTLPKTASSSSVATVVSKEADGSRSTDLINDLTKGLQLVKSLIAETRGDKEKQGRLLAHVVQQLKTVEERKYHSRHQRRTKKHPIESNTSSNAADSSSNSSDLVGKLKSSFLSHKPTASGDSTTTSTALESSAHSEVDETCRKLLSGMSNPVNERLVAWANSQERLAEYPPDPKLSKSLKLNDVDFAKFLQDYINIECQRQACWRSDILNLMSKRAEIVKQKQEVLKSSKDPSSRSSSQSSLRSEKLELYPSHLFPFTLNPSTKSSSNNQLDLEPRAQIFQHIINPSADDVTQANRQRPALLKPSKPVPPKEKADNGKVPSNLDAFLADPNQLTLFKPSVVEKAKKKMKTPTKTKDSSPQRSNNFDMPLQELLRKRKPNFIKRAENRRKGLAMLGEKRQQRGIMRRQCLKEQVDRYSGALPEDLVLDSLPPPPLAEYRLFTQHQMKEQTEKKYKNLEEIQKKEELKKRDEEHKTNRLMAQIFKRKLQNRVLQHKVNLSNSMSVITTDD